jgi:hypothetical protein
VSGGPLRPCFVGISCLIRVERCHGLPVSASSMLHPGGEGGRRPRSSSCGGARRPATSRRCARIEAFARVEGHDRKSEGQVGQYHHEVQTKVGEARSGSAGTGAGGSGNLHRWTGANLGRRGKDCRQRNRSRDDDPRESRPARTTCRASNASSGQPASPAPAAVATSCCIGEDKT